MTKVGLGVKRLPPWKDSDGKEICDLAKSIDIDSIHSCHGFSESNIRQKSRPKQQPRPQLGCVLEVVVLSATVVAVVTCCHSACYDTASERWKQIRTNVRNEKSMGSNL